MPISEAGICVLTGRIIALDGLSAALRHWDEAGRGPTSTGSPRGARPQFKIPAAPIDQKYCMITYNMLI